jgi:rhamnosyltransferase
VSRGEDSVSILLLTRNGAATLPATLDAIATQRPDAPLEIVAVDSGSTDGTRELLGRRVDRVLDVPGGRFNHGTSRNLGMAACRGELVVLLVQDALPASPAWLAALVTPLLADGRVAGSFARQVPRPDASALTRRALAGYAATGDVPRVAFVADARRFATLVPREQVALCTFDNVCSCIRRTAWRAHPFPGVPIAEDVAWAKRVLLAGWGLAYAPDARVVHSHDRPARYEWRRTCLVHRELYRLFGLETVPTARQLARAIAACVVAHVRCVVCEGAGARDLPRALALAVAWPLGQYVGALAGRRGWSLAFPDV